MDDGGWGWRMGARARLCEDGLHPSSGRGLLVDDNPLVLVVKVLALDLELGLEGSLSGSFCSLLLLKAFQLLLTTTISVVAELVAKRHVQYFGL